MLKIPVLLLFVFCFFKVRRIDPDLDMAAVSGRRSFQIFPIGLLGEERHFFLQCRNVRAVGLFLLIADRQSLGKAPDLLRKFSGELLIARKHEIKHEVSDIALAMQLLIQIPHRDKLHAILIPISNLIVRLCSCVTR